MHLEKRLGFVFVLSMCAAEPLSTMTPDEMTALTVEGVLEHVVIYEPLPLAPEYKRNCSII